MAKKASGVCSVGEPGVCYDVSHIYGRPVCSFIFQRGGYDGFDAAEVGRFLAVPGIRSASASDYRFEDVARLAADHAAGRFQEAFTLGRLAVDEPARPGAATGPRR